MKSILLTAFILIGLVFNAGAQEDKKVVIKKVEKSEIREGEKSGGGKEKTITINVDTDKEIESEDASLSITKEIVNGKEKSVYKLVENNGGEVKVIEWDGEGEMPAEIREKMKAVDVAIEDGGKEVIWIEKNMAGSPKGKRKHMMMHEMNHPQPKVKLGVMISDHNNGVNIDEVFKGSAADKAGMEKGDIILKINDKYIFSEEALFETLAGFKEGDKISITALRNNKEKSMNLTF